MRHNNNAEVKGFDGQKNPTRIPSYFRFTNFLNNNNKSMGKSLIFLSAPPTTTW